MLKVGAVGERLEPDVRDAVRDGDAGDARDVTERIISDACDPAG